MLFLGCSEWLTNLNRNIQFCLVELFPPVAGFQSVNFGVNSDISDDEDGVYLGECVFYNAILFFISVSHLASRVIVKPNYLKVSTCFILTPLHRMSDCFEMTMHSVFFAFS